MPRRRFIVRPRIKDFDYTGLFAYHIVFVAAGRKPLLVGDVADSVRERLRESASFHEFDVLAFVIMPDHAHLLIQGSREDSNLIRFVQRFKQRTGYPHM